MVIKQQRRAQQEREREAKLKKAALQVNTNNDNVLCFELQLQDQQAEILVKEEDWKDLTAREARLVSHRTTHPWSGSPANLQCSS